MDMVIEFVDFCVMLVFWIFLANALISFLAFIVSKRVEQQLAADDEDERVLSIVADLIHSVEVEEHNGVFYWFDSADGEFLAQGKDIDEAMSQLKSRFPKHVFFLKAKEKVYKISGPDWDLVPVDS